MATIPNAASALAVCEQGSDTEVERLLGDLTSDSFLLSLDDPSVYGQRLNPPNLGELLGCLAQRKSPTGLVDRIVELAAEKAYARSDPRGELRRVVLIQSLGKAVMPTARTMSFLEGEIRQGDYYVGIAVGSLIAIADPNAMAILWKTIFNPGTSVIAAHERGIYVENYTYELGAHRDKVAVLHFLLTSLYSIDARNAVIRCITDDVIERSPQAEYNVRLPPLTKDTPNSVALAQQLAGWIMAKGVELKEFENFTAITARVCSLLGLPASEPPTGEANDVRTWAVRQFEDALRMERDEARRKQLQDAVNGL